MSVRSEVFLPEAIFLDRDRDGITDTVDLQIHLGQGCGMPAVLSAVMDLCAAIGFETMAMDLPLVTPDIEETPGIRHHLHVGIGGPAAVAPERRSRRRWFVTGDTEDALAEALGRLTARLIERQAAKHPGLPGAHAAKLFDGDRDGSLLREIFARFPYQFTLVGPLGIRAAAAAANLAARVGLEALALSSPITAPRGQSGEGSRVYIGRRDDILQLSGLTPIRHLVAEWSSAAIFLPARARVPDILIYGDGSVLERTLDFFSRFPLRSDDWDVPWWRKLVGDVHGLLAGQRRKTARRRGPETRTYQVSDERVDLCTLLRQRLAQRPPSRSIRIDAFIARPAAERRRFADTVKTLCARRRPGLRVTASVLNAYKPGLCWLTEVVGPALARARADRVEITFKAFKERGMEESVRWLQEIHPVDEILSRRLGIARARIRFVRDGHRDATVYRVRAWRGDIPAYESRFSPHWHARPYLNAFPRAGSAHPTTGWIQLVVDGDEVLNQRVMTPVERMWETYQEQVLPEVVREAAKIVARPGISPGVLFEELRIDVFFAYPPEWLRVGEERLSPLEALHEDLYFVTLDFFGRWLKRRRARGWSPGRILPVVHPDYQGADGRIKVTLVPRQIAHAPLPASPIRVELTGLAPRGKHLDVSVALTPAPAHMAAASGRSPLMRMRRIGTTTQRGLSRFHGIASIPNPAAEQAARRNAVASIPLDRPLGYAEGKKIAQSLDGLAGVRVLEDGASFAGLPIQSIEVTHPCPSTCVSHLKRCVFRSTVFVNCRHHANEVSSTNAGLELARLLATVPRFQRLLQKTNVVITPMENVDGVRVFEELARLAPRDKLHAARYNAAGQEYYGEYFNPDTLFGEARVKPALWRRWQPDVCIDSHGFPSHEWEQPFSGYAPWRFREFWVPRALIYVYLSHLEKGGGSLQRRNAAFLKEWLIRALSRDRWIRDANARFGERYWTYREAWARPRRHASDPVPCLPLGQRFRQTNYAYRFPEITTVDLITEVADETAWGPYLRGCVAAHLTTDVALIHLLNRLSIRAKKLSVRQGRETRLAWHRDRPLVFH